MSVPLYGSHLRTLAVGEGDFSFALAIAREVGGGSLTATCLDTEAELWSKYGDAALANVAALRQLGAAVRFRVDATKLERDLRGEWFDVAVFNMPFGAYSAAARRSRDADVVANRTLVANYLASASRVANEVYVNLLSSQYERWQVESDAEQRGLCLVSSRPMRVASFPGYVNRYGDNRDARKAPWSMSSAQTYVFARTSPWNADRVASLLAAETQRRGTASVHFSVLGRKPNRCFSWPLFFANNESKFGFDSQTGKVWLKDEKEARAVRRRTFATKPSDENAPVNQVVLAPRKAIKPASVPHVATAVLTPRQPASLAPARVIQPAARLQPAARVLLAGSVPPPDAPPGAPPPDLRAGFDAGVRAALSELSAPDAQPVDLSPWAGDWARGGLLKASFEEPRAAPVEPRPVDLFGGAWTWGTALGAPQAFPAVDWAQAGRKRAACDPTSAAPAKRACF